MFVKRFIDHDHEVMFRILHNGGRCTFSTIEDKLLKAAQKLAFEGFLTMEPAYPCGGRDRTPFALDPKCGVTLQHLKDTL